MACGRLGGDGDAAESSIQRWEDQLEWITSARDAIADDPALTQP